MCERMAVFFAQFSDPTMIDYEALSFDCPELFRTDIATVVDEVGVGEGSADLIRRVLDECDNSRSAAARRLGISRATLWRRLRALHIDDIDHD